MPSDLEHASDEDEESVLDMAQQTVKVTRNIQEKLLSVKPGTCGILVGWYIDSQVSCLGCCADPKLIPVGLQAVGAFCVPEQNVTDKEAVSLCEEILRQQWENCPEEDSAVVLYPQTSDSNLKPYLTSLTYSLEYGNIQAMEVVLAEEEELYSQHVLLRAKGSLPLVFEESEDEELLQQSIQKIRRALSSGVIALHLTQSPLLLSHENSRTLSVRDLLLQAEATNQTPKSKSKRQKSIKEKDALTFTIFLQSTNLSSDENENHTPLIRYQRNAFKCVTVPLTFDVVALQYLEGSASDAYHALAGALANQLDSFVACLLKLKNKNLYETPQPFCFWPGTVGFPLNIMYPKEFDDSQLAKARQELHEDLFLALDRPLFKKLNRLEYTDELAQIPYLRNTHLGLTHDIPGQGYKVALVHGTYTYHHYMQDHVDDNGWGCAYRSLQTIVSWFRHQGYTDKPVPSHKEIQQALVDVGDKPSSFVGSKKWIGSQEVSFCLDQLIGVTSKIMFVNSGAELSNKGRELLNHFQNQGTPIMIGGGVLAHTIIGVKYNDLTGDIGYLILDPHYTGAEDLHVIQNKEWCGWKGPQFWDKTAFYNLCLPQRPATF